MEKAAQKLICAEHATAVTPMQGSRDLFDGVVTPLSDLLNVSERRTAEAGGVWEDGEGG